MIKTDHQIAYKPLGMSSSSAVDGSENDDDDDDDNNELVTQKQYSDSETKLPFSEINMFSLNPSDKAHGTANCLSFRRLRSTLYLAAAILFLIFVARLATNTGNSEKSPEESPPSASYLRSAPLNQIQLSSLTSTQSNGVISPISAVDTIREESTTVREAAQRDNDRPRYDNYLLSVLRDKDPRASNSNQSLDDLQVSESGPSASSSSIRGVWWTVGSRGLDDKYTTVTNYIRAMKSFNSNSSITLTTQATTEFMYHILELCKRWDGPISVALYGPGSEMSIAMTVIKFMRQCLPVPLGTCVRDKVSWHLVYDKLHGPPANTLRRPKYYVDSEHYPLFANQNECPKLAGPDASDLIKQFESDLRRVHGRSATPNSSNSSWPSYRQQFKLTYPINVLRNTARLAAATHFVLASDVELYPSVNLVPQFFNLIRNKFKDEESVHKVSREFGLDSQQNGGQLRYVFTLPIFEVKSNTTAPRTKKELVRLFEQGDAIFFHKYVCDACQNFTNRMDWLKRDEFVDRARLIDPSAQTSDRADGEESLVIFEATQRDKTREFWEPIFIGTNEQPLYDDRLTWDGRRDKMGQMYEMCLQDYHLFVLGNAFLSHAPGIKRFDKQDFRKRLDFMRTNNMFYDDTIKRLRQQYANSKNINKC